MSSWTKIDEIKGIGPESESEMLVLIWWLMEGAKGMHLLESGTTHAIHLHQATDLGMLDRAETGWESSAITIVDANGIQKSFLEPLIDTLWLPEKAVYIGVVGDLDRNIEEQILSSDMVEAIRLNYLGSFSIDVRDDKSVEIKIFTIAPQEPKQTAPSLSGRFRKRQVMETTDNLAGREKWFKKRNEK